MGDVAQTTVEMLWEDIQPDDALRERFGFASAADAIDWLTRILSGSYGTTELKCTRIIMSDTNALAWVTSGGASFVAKWSIATEKFARLIATAELTVWLADKGIPVAAPVPTLDGALQLEVDGVSFGLQPCIDGKHADATKPSDVRGAGRILAEIHSALREYPAAADFPDVKSWPGPKSLIQWWLKAVPDHVCSEAVDALQEVVKKADVQPEETQLVHGDFRGANLLMTDGNLPVVLDFEEVQRDTPINKIAKSAVMLGTLFRDWGPVSPAVHEQFLAGYESVRPLRGAERSWFKPLTLWWSLVMTPVDDRAGWGAAATVLSRECRRP